LGPRSNPETKKAREILRPFFRDQRLRLDDPGQNTPLHPGTPEKIQKKKRQIGPGLQGGRGSFRDVTETVDGWAGQASRAAEVPVHLEELSGQSAEEDEGFRGDLQLSGGGRGSLWLSLVLH
jgi:hypothetical protein